MAVICSIEGRTSSVCVCLVGRSVWAAPACLVVSSDCVCSGGTASTLAPAATADFTPFCERWLGVRDSAEAEGVVELVG